MHFLKIHWRCINAVGCVKNDTHLGAYTKCRQFSQWSLSHPPSAATSDPRYLKQSTPYNGSPFSITCIRPFPYLGHLTTLLLPTFTLNLILSHALPNSLTSLYKFSTESATSAVSVPYIYVKQPWIHHTALSQSNINRKSLTRIISHPNTQKRTHISHPNAIRKEWKWKSKWARKKRSDGLTVAGCYPPKQWMNYPMEPNQHLWSIHYSLDGLQMVVYNTSRPSQVSKTTVLYSVMMLQRRWW